MALTHDFKETIRARAERDSAFRHALLEEATEAIRNGDHVTGQAVLRDYLNEPTPTTPSPAPPSYPPANSQS